MFLCLPDLSFGAGPPYPAYGKLETNSFAPSTLPPSGIWVKLLGKIFHFIPFFFF